MSSPIPSSLALAVISNGQPADATPVASNFSLIQASVNELATALSGGSAGNVLQAADGTDVQWAVPKGPLVHGTHAGNQATANGTYGTGVDLLTADLSFTADGTSDYRLDVIAPSFQGSVSGVATAFFVKLDNAQSTEFGVGTFNSTSGFLPGVASVVLIAPASGSHTINARLVNGGAGGTATVAGPILVQVSKL